MNKAKAISIEYFSGPGYLGHMTELMKQILHSWSNYPSLRSHVASSMLFKLQYDWQHFEKQWKRAGGHSSVTDSSGKFPDYPFLHGLKVLADQMYKRLFNSGSRRGYRLYVKA